MADVTCALDADTYPGETPVWSVADQALWCEQPAAIHRWTPETAAHDV